MLIPTWLVPLAPLAGSAVALLTAVLAFRTSRRANALAERTTAQQDRRGRSEETMRLLRWAVELALADDGRRCAAGVPALTALADAHLVVRGDRTFVQAVAAATMAFTRDEPGYAASEEFHLDADPEGDDSA